MTQTTIFSKTIAAVFRYFFIDAIFEWGRKDTQFPYNIFTKHRFIPSQIYIYPLTNPFKLLFCNILIISVLPPPTQNIPFNLHKKFFLWGFTFWLWGIKLCASNGKIPESLRSEKIFRSFRISGCGSHEHHEIDRHIGDLPIAIHPPFIGDDRSITFYTFQINFTVKNYTFQYNFQLKKYTFQIKWHYLLQ